MTNSRLALMTSSALLAASTWGCNTVSVPHPIAGSWALRAGTNQVGCVVVNDAGNAESISGNPYVQNLLNVVTLDFDGVTRETTNMGVEIEYSATSNTSFSDGHVLFDVLITTEAAGLDETISFSMVFDGDLADDTITGVYRIYAGARGQSELLEEFSATAERGNCNP